MRPPPAGCNGPSTTTRNRLGAVSTTPTSRDSRASCAARSACSRRRSPRGPSAWPGQAPDPGPRAADDASRGTAMRQPVERAWGVPPAPRPPRPTALATGTGAAAVTGLGIVALRLIRKESLRQALGGLAGLTVAVLFAATSGEARGFFLPGILVDAAYGAVFAGSALNGSAATDPAARARVRAARGLRGAGIGP